MNLLNNVLFLVFPPVCGICEKTGKSYLCDSCRKNLQNSNIYLNKKDNYIQDNAKYFDFHYYLFSYESSIREKIIQYKFQNKAYLSNTFFEFFIKNEKLCRFLKMYYDIIIPVPMSRKKLAQRGYNQSELIASKISRYSKIQLQKDIIIKVKENKTQSTLNKIQRLENIKNVYKIKNKQKIKAKNILLFDDIYTTGATVNECAKILKQAGAKTVNVLTIAKDFKK